MIDYAEETGSEKSVQNATQTQRFSRFLTQKLHFVQTKSRLAWYIKSDYVVLEKRSPSPSPPPSFNNSSTEYNVVDEFVYKYIIYTPSVNNVLFKRSVLEEMHDFAIRTNKLHCMPGDASVLMYLKDKGWVENEYGQWTKVKSTYNSSSVPLRKKRHISKSVKALIWEMYIGRHIIEHKCLCCKLRNIRIDDFHAGHVQSEYNGGSDELSNLRPICGQCNSGMRTTNMIEYVKRHGFYIG